MIHAEVIRVLEIKILLELKKQEGFNKKTDQNFSYKTNEKLEIIKNQVALLKQISDQV